MEAQQEFFTALRAALLSIHPGMVYDTFLPAEGTPYPIIYLAGTDQTELNTKSAPTVGRITQDVRIWHDDPRKRGTVSSLMADVKAAARGIHYTEHYKYDVTVTESQLTSDTSVSPPLVYGIIGLTANYSLRR